MSTPVTPKKNTRAFGGSGVAAASSEWYDAKLQNCIDFDKAGMRQPFSIINNNNMTIFLKFLYMMLQENLSALVERTSSECPLFLCTEDLEKLRTSLSTPLYQFFSRCPLMPRGCQALQPLHLSALLPMMSCLLIFITLSFMGLYLVMYDGIFCFVFFCYFNHPCDPVMPAEWPPCCRYVLLFF